MEDHLNLINKYKLLLSVFTSILLCYHLPAQSALIDTTTSTIFKQLQRDTIAKLTLNTDLKTLIKKKHKEEWQPVEIETVNKDNQTIQYSAKVRTRGNIRKDVCYYPPLKLKFKKRWLSEKGLDSTFNDLKLVVGCRRSSLYNKLVLKEYLTYQLYEALTEFSFKTQLFRLNLVDSNKDWNTVESMGFLIENDEELAARFMGRRTKPVHMRSRSIDPAQWAFLSLFQFMIGNTDWALSNSHNIRFITSKAHDKVIPIAYDFDYSGLVNAPYAVHRESINIDEITVRYFLGSCEIREQLSQQIPLFLDKKATLYKIVNDFDLLSVKDRGWIIDYLDGFYDIISNPKRFKRAIVDQCIDKN